MLPNREYLRTPTDAAATARRFGHDFKLAARLHAHGLNPYKGQMPVFLVDLATEGSLTEPRGVPLRHSKLFNTQAAVSAFELQRDIEAFDEAYQPDNVVHIVLRPPLALGEVKKNGEKRLLDENGRCPIANLRSAQKAFNNCVQRAVAELDRRQVIVPLLVARHLVPFEGGATFDLHAHWVGQLKPEDISLAQEYLSSIFGADRFWISSVMEPGERRSFSATSGYPVWRLANQDWNAVDDDHLKDFFNQASGLRSLDALGPFRHFRAQAAASSVSNIRHGDGDHDPEIFENGECPAEPSDQFATPDGAVETPVDDVPASRQDHSGDAGADVSSFLPSEPARQPVLFGCHFAWLGLTRRYVAQVGNYTSFAELRQYYDLDDAIAFAKRHVEETHSYLLEPAIHENSFEAISGTAGTAVGVGESRPAAKPQQFGEPKAVAEDGTAGTAAGVGESRPAAEPQQFGEPKAVAEDGTAGTAAGVGESRPAAEPQQFGEPKAVAEDGTAGTAAGVGESRPAAEPQQSGEPKAVAEDGTAGTAAGAGESRPAAEPQQSGEPKAVAVDGKAGTAAGAGESRPAAEPQQSDGPKAVAEDVMAGTAAGVGESYPGAKPRHVGGPKAAAEDGTAGAQASVNGRAKDLPLTLEREAGINSDAGVGFGRTLAGLTLELTVQAQSGPATATLRLRMPGVHFEQH
ncbi:hypothetical protein [Bradyrhizobium liaoningense]|uniref:hypothetical protein n=1 Tax=Bradyrhizobium liaoningense TaxID=43992 RepID=UPI001BA89B88|nr:hypothetical protein [Bradyrhizobium liaoningense]MBR0860106.1 hypothetical protein [Bradyrhizobium liaoningense]